MRWVGHHSPSKRTGERTRLGRGVSDLVPVCAQRACNGAKLVQTRAKRSALDARVRGVVCAVLVALGALSGGGTLSCLSLPIPLERLWAACHLLQPPRPLR